jgi:ribosomal protein L11 methyltransferase
VPLADAEEARARLIAIAPAGFEEVERGTHVELAAYGDAAEKLAAAFPEAQIVEIEPGWEDRWREFHRPVVIGPLWIGPPWEQPPADAVPVVIDPGRAFGTGSHPTTRLCLELLLGQQPTSVLDVGCGSGVLSIANAVEVDARRGDATAEALPAAALTIANISLDVVSALRPRGEFLITSGYLERDDPRVAGWTRVRRVLREGWAADLHAPR